MTRFLNVGNKTLSPSARREREDGYIFELEQKSGKVMEQFVAATESYRNNQQQLEDTIRWLHLANSVLQRERDLLQEVVSTYERVLESTGHRFLLIKVKEHFRTYRQQEQEENDDEEEVSPLTFSPQANLNRDVSEDNYEHIFEELQSSLFPPGSLQSFQIDMSNLQVVLNDHSLFDPKSPPPIPAIPHEDLEARRDGKAGERREGVSYYAWDQLEQMEVEFSEEAVHHVASLVRLTVGELKAHRLYRGLMLAGLQQPKTIPGVLPPALFEVPQDPRIRAAPCAYLRARMILHRGKYDLDEVVRLLIDTSVVYGDPRHGNNWAISEEFVSRLPY
ncbi:hypothetical protein BGZ81_004574 [Podila clonocystis]|nr:hypothetical protein BGZ81_004574 [Podila clonocystis]